MKDHNTYQHSNNQKQHHLATLASSLLDRSAQTALHTHHWMCTGCGATHSKMLPEECKACGATALEFTYMAPAR